MRIALISDIHGNLVSFEAVLADIEREGVDDIICLGDVATLGAQPIEVIERLEGLGCRTIMGNHDAFLIDQDDIAHYTDEAEVLEMVEWCKGKLSSAELDFIRTFDPVYEVKLSDKFSMVCFHGSPRSNTEILLATTPDEALAEMLKGYDAPIMAGGHTHIQLFRRYLDTVVVNPGSVGAPFWQMPPVGRLKILPWASYAIIEVNGGGLNVDMRRVEVDLEAVQGAILASDMANPERWLTYWD